MTNLCLNTSNFVFSKGNKFVAIGSHYGKFGLLNSFSITKKLDQCKNKCQISYPCGSKAYGGRKTKNLNG